MAERFVEQATSQLAPVYDQQASAISAQIPAIQQLYTTLLQGLEGQGKAQGQQLLESASSRGLTRSSIPFDMQTALGQSLLQERGKLGAQQAQDIAGIQTKLGDLNIQKAQGIQGLADTLYSRDLKERQFQMEQQQAERNYQLKIQEINASKAAQAATQKGAPAGLVNTVYGLLNSKKGGDGFVSPNVFRAGQQQWIQAGGSPASFVETFGWAVNPKHQERFGGYY